MSACHIRALFPCIRRHVCLINTSQESTLESQQVQVHGRPWRLGAPKPHPVVHEDFTPDIANVSGTDEPQQKVEHPIMVVADKDPALVHEGPLPARRGSRVSSCRGIAFAVAPLAIPGSPAVADVLTVPVCAVGPDPFLRAAPLVACTDMRSVTHCDPGQKNI